MSEILNLHPLFLDFRIFLPLQNNVEGSCIVLGLSINLISTHLKVTKRTSWLTVHEGALLSICILYIGRKIIHEFMNKILT